MNLKYLKLVNEMDIVSELEEIDADTVKLTNPLVIIVLGQKEGQTAITLQPYLLFTKETEFVMRRNNVMVITEPDPIVSDLYAKRLSKIITPTKELVLPV